MTGSRAIALATVLAVPFAIGACGGARQDATERSGNFDVSIVKSSFPASQAIAQPATMTIAVRNDGNHTVPNLAVTVNSFSVASQQPGLADPGRPVWVVDSGPQGAETAYTNTWAAGALAPGHVRTFVWHVTAIVPGQHTIRYRLAAGLNGKAHARLAGGGTPQGSFRVNVSGQPGQARVDPNTGRVVRTPSSSGGRGGGTRRGGQGRGYGSQGANSQQPGSGSGSQPGSGAGSQSGGSQSSSGGSGSRGSGNSGG